MPQEQFALIKDSTSQIWSNPTWDIILLLALLGAGFFYGISSGKRRMAATILYTYVALAVASALPEERLGSIFANTKPFLVEASLFFIIFLLLALLLGTKRRKRAYEPAASWWQVFILSFAQVGLLVHILLSFLPTEEINSLAPVTRTVFANPTYHIWWLVVPLLMLVVLRRIDARVE